jgi:hypothetical protein
VPVPTFGQRKFVFRFYKDDRDIFKRLEPWNIDHTKLIK